MNVQLSIVRASIREYRKASVEGIEPSRHGFGIRSATIAHRRGVKRAKKKEPSAAGHPAQTAPGRISRSEITQVGRPHAGSARCRAGGRRRLRTRIAGMPTKPWGQAAMPFSGSACRTRCLLDVVVVAGISLTHPTQPSQRICRFNCSRTYLPPSPTYAVPHRFPIHLDARASTPRPLQPPGPSGSAASPRLPGPSTDRHHPATIRTNPTPRGIRFGITPTLPLHSCLGVRATRRLSSVGRASHS